MKPSYIKYIGIAVCLFLTSLNALAQETNKVQKEQEREKALIESINDLVKQYAVFKNRVLIKNDTITKKFIVKKRKKKIFKIDLLDIAYSDSLKDKDVGVDLSKGILVEDDRNTRYKDFRIFFKTKTGDYYYFNSFKSKRVTESVKKILYELVEISYKKKENLLDTIEAELFGKN